MNLKETRHLAGDMEKSPEVQMAQRRDHVILRRAQSAIDRTKHMVAMEIKRDQKLLNRNFQVQKAKSFKIF